MNRNFRSAPALRSGEAIYVLLLAAACVALAVAAFFPVYEYVTLFNPKDTSHEPVSVPPLKMEIVPPEAPVTTTTTTATPAGDASVTTTTAPDATTTTTVAP